MMLIITKKKCWRQRPSPPFFSSSLLESLLFSTSIVVDSQQYPLPICKARKNDPLKYGSSVVVVVVRVLPSMNLIPPGAALLILRIYRQQPLSYLLSSSNVQCTPPYMMEENSYQILQVMLLLLSTREIGSNTGEYSSKYKVKKKKMKKDVVR